MYCVLNVVFPLTVNSDTENKFISSSIIRLWELGCPEKYKD